MKSRVFSVLLTCLLIVGAVLDASAKSQDGEDDDSSTVVALTPAPTPVEIKAEGRTGWRGFGLRYAGIRGTGMLGTEAAPIVGFRRWVDNRQAYEILGGFGSSISESRPDFGTGYSYADRQTSIHFGLGYQRNLSEPVPGLLLQGIGNLIGTYSNYSTVVTTDGSSVNGTGWAVDFFVGLGFEYFIPKLERISLEGGAGFDVNYRAIPTADNAATIYGLTLNSTSQVPVNLLGVPLFGAIHWYF
jgi:hypothetical protein